jgi:pyruvate decarboxylase
LRSKCKPVLLIGSKLRAAGAIETAVANHDGPTLIECIIDRDDCSPELISWGHLVARANARPPSPQ